MNGEIGDPGVVKDAENDTEPDEFSEETVILEEVADDVGDLSVELDVSQLVAKLESPDGDDIQRKREIHRRLEEVQEQKEKEKNIDSTFNFNLDEEL